jgi:hypothetical protein
VVKSAESIIEADGIKFRELLLLMSPEEKSTHIKAMKSGNRASVEKAE